MKTNTEILSDSENDHAWLFIEEQLSSLEDFQEIAKNFQIKFNISSIEASLNYIVSVCKNRSDGAPDSPQSAKDAGKLEAWAQLYLELQ